MVSIKGKETATPLNYSKNKVAAKVGSKTKSSVSTIGEDFRDAYELSFKSYWKQLENDSRLKLIDIFCVFLVLFASIQCIFMIAIRDNFPFNAFLSGFIVCVGQFVLLISLRLQLLDPFPGISKSRAFGEFILASLILHFICLHFIN